MLYQWEVGGSPIGEVTETYWFLPDAAPIGDDEPLRDFAAALAIGTATHLPEIDPLIAESAEHWRPERMATIDRLIVRLAVYEFLYQPGTPASVVINEALELAKTFSADDAVGFVNGLLDGIRKKLETRPEGRREASPGENR